MIREEQKVFAFLGVWLDI